MNCCVNGKWRRFNGEMSVEVLVSELGLADRKIAVECNGEIVSRSRHPVTILAEGDCIEIVVAVGGG